MSLTTSEMTPADLAAVTGNNDGFGGGNGAWWIIILFLFAFCGGWNNGGNGLFGNGGGNSGAADNYVLASDFATLQRQIDTAADGLRQQSTQIANGLCDGFYNMNTTLLNGFNGVNNSVQAAQVSQMQSANAIQTQLAQCCCDNREAISGVNYNMAMNANATQRAIENGFAQTGYNMATNACATNTAIASSTRDVLENQNSNTRAILDALNEQRTDALKEQIAAQNQQIFGLQLAASQAAQNSYLVNAIRPCPVPAYSVPAPFGVSNSCGCGCNCGC